MSYSSYIFKVCKWQRMTFVWDWLNGIHRKNGIHLISDREMSVEVCLSADKIKDKWKGRNEMPSNSSWFRLSEVVCLCDWGCLEGHSQGHGSRSLKDTSLLDEREWGGWCKDNLVPSPNSKTYFIFWWDVKFSIAKRRSWKLSSSR